LEQEVALRALEAFRRLNKVTHPRALLMKIVRDTVRDHWRRKRSSEELAGIDEKFIAHVPAFESNLDQQRRVELLRRALTRLPPRPPAKRRLRDLFYINDQSIPQIAALQDRSVSAVKMELARSRQSLSRIIHSMLNQRNPWNSRL